MIIEFFGFVKKNLRRVDARNPAEERPALGAGTYSVCENFLFFVTAFQE